MSKPSNFLERYRGFKVTYKPATDTKPSRICIRDLKRNDRRFISYDYEDGDHTAIRFLEKKGIKVFGMVVAQDVILLSENFEISIKN